MAYAFNGAFVRWQSLFRVPAQLSSTGLADYPWYIALGAASGVVATILPEVFYRVRDAIAALGVAAWLKPGLGGLIVGLMALRLPEAPGGGYGWIQQAIDGQIVFRLLFVLLVAKMLSLVIQMNLSSFFKYGSLYEAQVAGRADSPAHRAELVQLALRLLEQTDTQLPAEVTHLHLASLLQSGGAMDLPDNSKLLVGALQPANAWVGKSLKSRSSSRAVEHSRLVAVVRGKSVSLAGPDTMLQPGDRLLLVAQPEVQQELAQHIASAPSGPPVGNS